MSNNQLLTSALLLLIAKLTGVEVPADQNDKVGYLTDKQAEQLAAEAIGLLASYLPQETRHHVSSAIEKLPHLQVMNHLAIETQSFVLSVGLPVDGRGGAVCMRQPGGGTVCFN